MNILNYQNKLFSNNYEEWLNNFEQGKEVFPKIIELDPTTSCMFSCPECISANLLNGKTIKQDNMYHLIDEFSEVGVKGIIFIGGGEPLMYPRFGELLKYSSSKGIKNGITTNGLLIDKYKEVIANNCEWIRVSIDASNEKSFQTVRPNRVPNSFNRIIKGMEQLSKIKKGLMGFSFLLLETRGFENASELYEAAKLAKEIGCDYFEYKPMVDNNHYLVEYSEQFINEVKIQQGKALDLEDETFKILKPKSMELYFNKAELKQPKAYRQCPVTRLRTLVTANGIYPCPYKRGFEEFNMGDVSKGFKETYRDGIEKVYPVLDPSKHCNFYCIRNDINEILLSILLGNTKTKDVSFNQVDDVFV